MEGDAVATFQPPEPQGNGRPQATPPDPGADPVGVPLSAGYRPSAPWQWFWTRDGLPRPPVLYDLEEMLRHPRVKTALNFFRGALAGATVKVTRASSPAVLAYAQVELDRFWQRGRPDAQRADEYGWLGAEVCYARKEGRVVFDRLLPFHPNDTRVLLRDHLYAGVRVTGVPDRPQLDLWGPGGNCLAKAFWAAHRPRFDRWYGQSQLAGAHRPFRRLAGRDCLEDVIDGGLYRYGVGGPVVRFPRGAPEVENQVQGSPKRRKNSDVAADIIEKMKAGSGYGIPSGTHPGTNEPLWGIEAFNPELDIAGLLEAERRLGELIALGIDVPPEVIEAGDTGTGYSGRAIPLESFLAGKTDDANALLRAWQWQIGEPLARWNFGPESWFEAEVEPLLQSHRAQAGGQAPPGEPPTPPGQPPRGPDRTPDGRPSSQLGLALKPEGDEHAVEEGQEQESRLGEHQGNEEVRPPAEAGGGRGAAAGGQGPQPEEEEGLSTLAAPRGGDCRWVTIGGRRGEDGKRHGGSPVCIQGGRIVKGHPSLTGKKVEALSEGGSGGPPGAKEPWKMTRDELARGPVPEKWKKIAAAAGHADPEQTGRHLMMMAAQDRAARVKEEFFGDDGPNPPHPDVDAAERELERTSKPYQRLLGELEKLSETEVDDPEHPVNKGLQRLIVKKVLTNGKSVPPEILAEYPDLKASTVDDDPSTHRQQVNQSRAYQRAVYAKQARQEGLDPKSLHQLAAEYLAHDKAHVADRVKVLQRARETSRGLGYGDLTAIKARNARGRIDADSIRGLDDVAERVAAEFPGVLGDNPQERLFDLLIEGNPQPASEDEAYQHSLEILREHGPAPKKERKSRKKGEAHDVGYGVPEFDISGLAQREYARDELGRFATRARQALARHPDPGPAPPLPPGALRPGAAADLGVAAALAAHHEHAQAYHRHVAAHNVYRALAGSAPPPVPPRPDLPPRRQAKLFHKAVERYGEEEFLAGRVHGPYAAAVHADDPGLLDVAKGAAAGRHAAALAQAAAHARSLAAALPEPVHRPMQAADLSAGHLIDAAAVHEGLRPAVEGLAAKLPHAEHESGLRLALPSTPEAAATLRTLSELGAASRLKDDPDAKREVLERLGPEGVKKLRGGGLSTLEVRHAPAGGAAAKGRQYKGGQFEPSDATAQGERGEEEGGERGDEFNLPPPPPKKDVKLGGEKFGPSKATASVTTSADRAAAKDLVVKLFGGTSAEAYQALASSVGAPDDAEVVVESVGKYDGLYSDDLPLKAVGVRVTIKHPKLAEASRFVGVDDRGRRFIKNEILRVKKEYQNEGLGADIFARQVEQAATNGFDDIRTHAAGKPGSAFNGYYTWPRFGYDMSLTDPDGVGSGWDARVYVQARQRFPGAKTVLDVMATKEGRDWWKQNGRDMYNAKFDLSEGSRSMKVLSAYLEERRSKKAEG